jgi:Protein of unknown function (DUF3110)
LIALSSASAFCPEHFSQQQRSLSRKSTQLFSIQEWEASFMERAHQNAGNMPEMVYTLVYNPYTDEEGVHTTEFPAGSGQQAMLVFESVEECANFAYQLGAEPSVPGQPVPTPTPLAQIEMACQQMGWALKVVPAMS